MPLASDKQQKNASGAEAKVPQDATEQNQHSALHTYERDVTEYLQSSGTSVSEIAAKEARRRATDGSMRADVPSSRRPFVLFLIAAFVLAVIASIGALLVFGGSAKKEPPSRPHIPAPLVSAAQIEIISIPSGGRAELLSQFQNLLRQQYAPGHVLLTPVVAPQPDGTRVALDSRAFFETMAASLPDALIRSLDGRLTLGMMPFGGQNFFFLVLGVRQPSRAVAGMLAWEGILLQSLRALYGPQFDTRSGIETYRDLTIANNSARVLANAAGNPILAYTLFNSDLLFIAPNPDVLSRLMVRVVVPAQ